PFCSRPRRSAGPVGRPTFPAGRPDEPKAREVFAKQSLARSEAKPKASETPGKLTHSSRHFPPGGLYFLSHANTSLCQCSLFLGLSTQCPSSGKFTKRLGTPWR